MANRRILSLMVLALLIGIGLIVAPACGLPRVKGVQAKGFVNLTYNATLDLANGQVDSFWSDPNITEQTISEFGAGSSVKFANNDSNLYALIVCSEDFSWISFEFEAKQDRCMMNLNDGWSFYIDKNGKTVEAKDVGFEGAVIPIDDTQDDLSIEYTFSGGMVSIEVLRPFDTQDTAGYDVVFQPDNEDTTDVDESLVNVIFASNVNHYSSHTVYYLQTVVLDLSSGEEPVIPPPPPAGPALNIADVKLLLFIAALTGTGGFMLVHLIRRVILTPIKHEVRVIYDDM
ncbi:MAG: hypothetical protein ACFFD4_10180 [Candidatus Odinarchaeota archaeon]